MTQSHEPNNDNKPRRDPQDRRWVLSLRDIKVGWLEAHRHRREGESRAFWFETRKPSKQLTSGYACVAELRLQKTQHLCGCFFCSELPPLHFVMSSQLSADDETMKKLCSKIFYMFIHEHKKLILHDEETSYDDKFMSRSDAIPPLGENCKWEKWAKVNTEQKELFWSFSDTCRRAEEEVGKI